MSQSVRRRGFTLPEVLVTITIVAVLAAVVVPAVLNQVSKGDDSAVSQDLISIRTGITTFTSDTRKFPGRLTDLGLDALISDSTDIAGAKYGSEAVSGYKGPYLTIVDSHKNPAGALFQNEFVLETNKVCLKDSTSTGGAGAISLSQADQMDRALDGVADSTKGAVVYHPADVSADSIVVGSFRACLTTR